MTTRKSLLDTGHPVPRPPSNCRSCHLQVLAASSALGLRSALALAVPRLLQARKQAAAAAAARKTGVAASGGGSTSGCCGGGSKSGGGGTNAGEVAGVAGGGGEGGGCCGGGGGDGGHADAVSSSAGSAADSEAFEDAQSARLGALAGLAAAVDDKVDGQSHDSRRCSVLLFWWSCCSRSTRERTESKRTPTSHMPLVAKTFDVM